MILNMASFNEVAWITQSARIYTLVIYASQLGGTVVVRCTFYVFHASIFSIWHKAGGTELADRFVLLHVTWGISRTGRVSAWVHAAIVAARQVWRAATVSQANGEGGIAVFDANAHGTMVQDIAGFISRTRSFVSHVTGILTFSIDTRGIRRTIKVPRAGKRVRSASQFPNFVDYKAVFTNAHGLVISHLTPLVDLAGVPITQTRVATLACLRVAGETLRTVVVGGTTDARRRFGIERVAFGIWMAGRMGHADIALRARATRLMQNHSTQGIDSTGTA